MRPMTHCTTCTTAHLVTTACPTCTRRAKVAKRRAYLDGERAKREARAAKQRAAHRRRRASQVIDAREVARQLGEHDGRCGLAPSGPGRFRGAGGVGAWRAYEAAYRRAKMGVDKHTAPV